MAVGFPTKANWAAGDVLTASAQDDLAGTLNLLSNASAAQGSVLVSNVAGTSFGYNPYMVAGKNFLINGNFDIWQRGTSFSANAYNADRWYMTQSGGSTAISQESTIIPAGSKYSLKIAQTSASGNVYVFQAIETFNVLPLAGQTVTLSALAAASASTSVSFQVGYSTTVDNSVTGSYTTISPTTGGSGTVSTTASFSKITGTYAIPSTAKTLQIVLSSSPASGTSVYWAQAQLELGSTATTFSRAGGTLQGELAACQRYLPALVAGGNETWNGFASSTTNSYVPIKFPVTARVQPTGITVSGTLSNYSLFNQSLTSASPTAITFDSAGLDQALIYITTTAGSPTIAGGQPILFRDGSSGYILFTGCEL